MGIEVERFYKYPPKRDVVFVFGAGASYADGAPLQADILPLIISGNIPEIKRSKIGKTVKKFITNNFAWNPEQQIYPTLETVFGFLDYFIARDEHLNPHYTCAQIRIIKEWLIKLIHFVISAKSNKQSKTYHSFWECVCKYNKNISILTLNYDTLLEEAFDFMYPEIGYIDYCVHLMNYDENLPRQARLLHKWVNPREPITVKDGNSPVSIKIMKAHGSLNWKYCNCCNQVLLTPWDTKIDLSGGVFKKSNGKYNCPVDGAEFETLIIPPSHIKKISHPVISQIINEALREIRSCRRVVFVGYSFPDADVHFKALFKKSLPDDADVIVINNSKKDKLKYNYLSLNKKVQFLNMSFTDFLNKRDVVEETIIT